MQNQIDPQERRHQVLFGKSSACPCKAFPLVSFKESGTLNKLGWLLKFPPKSHFQSSTVPHVNLWPVLPRAHVCSATLQSPQLLTPSTGTANRTANLSV